MKPRFGRKPRGPSPTPFCSLSAPLSNSLLLSVNPRSQSIISTVVWISIDCVSHYQAILELVTLRSPSLSLSLRLSDRSCCWMEEWALSVWVSPRGQLREIIRRGSYRQTDRRSRLKVFLSSDRGTFGRLVISYFP